MIGSATASPRPRALRSAIPPSSRSHRFEALPTSDVDLLVDLAAGRTLVDLACFRREAETILGLPVDVATADMLKERIRAEVLAGALAP